MKLLRMICGWLTKPSDLYMDEDGRYFTVSSMKSEHVFYWVNYRQDWAGQWNKVGDWELSFYDKRNYAVKV